MLLGRTQRSAHRNRGTIERGSQETYTVVHQRDPRVVAVPTVTRATSVDALGNLGSV